MQRKTFCYYGHRPNVKEAVRLSNQLINSVIFYESISKQTAFHMSDISADTLADLLENTELEMNIDPYYSLSPLSEVDGYDDKQNPFNVCMNVWRLDQPVAHLCNVMIHASVHALNTKHTQYFFGHDDIDDKELLKNTAPYCIGSLAQRIISGNNDLHEYMQHENVRNTVILKAII